MHLKIFGVDSMKNVPNDSRVLTNRERSNEIQEKINAWLKKSSNNKIYEAAIGESGIKSNSITVTHRNRIGLIRE
jgi:hypothetical protein